MSASTVKVVSTVFLLLLLLAPSVVLAVLPQPVSTSSRVSARAAQSAWMRRRVLLPAGMRAFMRHPSLEVTGLSMWLMCRICRAGTIGTRCVCAGIMVRFCLSSRAEFNNSSYRRTFQLSHTENFKILAETQGKSTSRYSKEARDPSPRLLATRSFYGKLYAPFSRQSQPRPACGRLRLHRRVPPYRSRHVPRVRQARARTAGSQCAYPHPW